MKKFRYSTLLSRLLVLKISRLKKIFNKEYYEKKLLFYIMKLSSIIAKKILSTDLRILSEVLKDNQLNMNFIKILISHNSTSTIKLIIKKFFNFKFNFISKQELVKLYEILFHSYSYTMGKNNFLSNLILKSSINIRKELKKTPYLRILLSGIPKEMKRKITISTFNLCIFFLENPMLCSKPFIQEIIWNQFRLKIKSIKYLELIQVIRSICFLNNSQRSFFFLSLIFEFFQIQLLRPFLNLIFKNIYKFIKKQNGIHIIIYIITYFLNQHFWFNFTFFKNLFAVKTCNFNFTVHIFCFLLRETSRIFKKTYTCFFRYKINRKDNNTAPIKKLSEFTKMPFSYFLLFFRYRVFENFSTIYPNFLQDEFIRLIETTKIIQNSVNFKKNKIEIAQNNLYENLKFRVEKKLFLLYSKKIKNYFSKFQVIFFILRKILKHFNFFYKKNFILGKHYLGLSCQVRPEPIDLKNNSIILITIPITTFDNIFINLYKQFKLYENQ